MARIIQVSCDATGCYNVIELADEEDLSINFTLSEFGWGVIDGEDFCQDHYDEYESDLEEEDEEDESDW